MSRPIEEVSIAHEVGPMEGDVHSHPAFAQIGACRVSGRASLYGSDFNHQNYVSIRIAKSEFKRSLSNDWMHANSMPYIEIDLSEAQWANFVTCMNIGGGTACTLRHLGGEVIPGLPDPASRKDQFKKEARATCSEALKRIDDLCAKVEAMTISRKARDELIKAARSAAASMTSSRPYVLEQFGEHMEVTVEKAKTEINAYVTQNVMRSGLSAIARDSGESAPLSLGGLGMSKQSDAKAAQGYQDKPEQKLCGGCQCLEIPMALTQWQKSYNEECVANRSKPRYTVERHGQPMTPRCGLGDFTVKKSATCSQWRAKADQP